MSHGGNSSKGRPESKFCEVQAPELRLNLHEPVLFIVYTNVAAEGGVNVLSIEFTGHWLSSSKLPPVSDAPAAEYADMADPAARVESVDGDEEEMNLMETGEDGAFWRSPHLCTTPVRHLLLHAHALECVHIV